MNRGVEKRKIFLDASDYSYMVHNLFVLNDQKPLLNTNRDFIKQNAKKTNLEVPVIGEEIIPQKIPRKLLVEILAFALMPNHFHLMVRQLTEGGIVKFMQKLGTSTTMRFNKKNKRVGPLFQGRFKAVLVEEEAQLLYLPHYIHLNPLDLINTIDGGPTSINSVYSRRKRMDILENYKWSSLPDYLGKRNFPSVTERGFLLDLFSGTEGYKQDISKLSEQYEKNTSDGMGNILLDINSD